MRTSLFDRFRHHSEIMLPLTGEKEVPKMSKNKTSWNVLRACSDGRRSPELLQNLYEKKSQQVQCFPEGQGGRSKEGDKRSPQEMEDKVSSNFSDALQRQTSRESKTRQRTSIRENQKGTVCRVWQQRISSSSSRLSQAVRSNLAMQEASL